MPPAVLSKSNLTSHPWSKNFLGNQRSKHPSSWFKALQSLVSICISNLIFHDFRHHSYYPITSAYSVQFSCSVVSNSLRPHGLQHTRLPCPSPTPGAYSNSCPSSWWHHPTISSPVVPFSSRPQFLPASRSFQMSQSFASGGQSIGDSASTSVLSMNIQDWFPLGLTSWFSLQSKGLKSLPQHHSSKASVLWCSPFFIVQLSHPFMTIGKTMALTRWTFVDKAMSLLFNMLSRLVIAFLPRRKCPLI